MQNDDSVIKSAPLKNGIYSFKISSFRFHGGQNEYVPIIAVAVYDADGKCLCKSTLEEDDIVSVYAYDNYLFLKCIMKQRYTNKVRIINSIDGKKLFSMRIHYEGILTKGVDPVRTKRVDPFIVKRDMEPYSTFEISHVLESS